MASGEEIPLAEAKQIAKDALEILSEETIKGTVVGSLARNHPTVHDIDLLVIPKPGSELEEDSAAYARALSNEFGVHIDIFLTTLESWESSLVHWVIGKSIIPLKAHARRMGLHLNRYGLFDHAERPITRTIRGIYDTLETPIPDSLKPFLANGPPQGRNRV